MHAPSSNILKEAVINSSHSYGSLTPSFHFQDTVPSLFLHWSNFPNPFFPFSVPVGFSKQLDSPAALVTSVSASPAKRWEMWNKWPGNVQAAPPTLPGTRLKRGCSDFHPVEGNETSKQTNPSENTEHILQELLAFLITRTAFPYDRNTKWRKAVPCRRNLARVQMPLCSSGGVCPRAVAAFAKPIHLSYCHSSCNLVILRISLPAVLAVIISPFDLFGCVFVLISAAVALPLGYIQEISSTTVVFFLIFINAVASKGRGLGEMSH